MISYIERGMNLLETLVHWTCVFTPGLFLVTFYLFLFLFLIPFCWPFMILYLLFINITNPSPMEILFWKRMRKATIGWMPTANYNEYFPVKGTVPTTPCIYALHPHGLVALTTASHLLNKQSPLYPMYHDNFIAVHSLLFKIPILRECLLWAGCMPVTSDHIQTMLARGHSVILAPGGVKEIEFSKEGTQDEIWSLKKHTGYLRIAQAHTIPIVPIYIEGEQDLMTWQYEAKPFNEFVFNITGFRSNPFYIAQCLLPHNIYKWFCIKPAMTTTHIGEPFYVKGDLEKAKQDYITHVSDLFHAVHDGKRTLVIQ